MVALSKFKYALALTTALLSNTACTYTSLDSDGTRHIYSFLGKVTLEPQPASAGLNDDRPNYVGDTVEVTGIGVLINVGGGQPGVTLGYGNTRSTLIYPNQSVLIDSTGRAVSIDDVLMALRESNKVENYATD